MNFAGMVDQFLDAYGLVAVFGLMLLKEIGVPVPIPSDLIMLGAAARAAQGRFPVAGAYLAILIPMILGGLVQYAVAKGPGRRVVYRLGSLIGLTRERLDRAMDAVRRGGPVAVAAGLTTPGVRIAIVPACGLAALPVGKFGIGLVIGSAFFLAWHFAVGYLGGLALGLLNLSLPLLLAVVAAVLLLGVAGWMAVRRLSRRGEEMTAAARYAAWADASCPACIAITLVRDRQTEATRPVGAVR